MQAGSNRETEIKLRVASAAAARSLLRRARFRVVRRRLLESNVVFDTGDLSLRARGCLLRLRTVGGRSILTFKGESLPAKHQSREEIETEIASPEALSVILLRLGFGPVFRYEKYRTEYQRGDEDGVVTLDETPIGPFLELEGEPGWIDRTAAALGFAPEDSIVASYASLFFDHCRRNGLNARHMTFPGLHSG